MFLCLFACVCMCVDMFVCVCMFVCLFACVCMFVYMFVCVCVCVYTCLCVYVSHSSYHYSRSHKLTGKPYHMSSFGESTAMKLSKDNSVRYVQYNRRQISRTYPAGGRVNSSNYDPVPMWNAGCQIGR